MCNERCAATAELQQVTKKTIDKGQTYSVQEVDIMRNHRTDFKHSPAKSVFIIASACYVSSRFD